MKEQDSDRIGQVTRISQLSRKAGLDPDEANELTERTNTMSPNTIFEQIDASIASLESKIDSQNTKYNVLIWAITFAGIVISAAIVFGN